MPGYTERDLKDASVFRDAIHREALEKVKIRYPGIEEILDPYPLEAFFEEKWDYPGAWYTYVTIPQGFRSRDDFVAYLVRYTIEHHSKNRFGWLHFPRRR